eukprot:TRINITY_DN165_c0_g1_i2.p1 TRINITY_DN165_c0_g1~~TRINITY_DN165_c0_g1_i2.p1  ORF type:complete len:323 (-),score=62.12 TRINITY_DN165_c0_g1_i2:180-1148(-)
MQAQLRPTIKVLIYNPSVTHIPKQRCSIPNCSRRFFHSSSDAPQSKGLEPRTPAIEGEVLTEEDLQNKKELLKGPKQDAISDLFKYSALLQKAYRWLGPNGNLNFMTDMSIKPETKGIEKRSLLNADEDIASTAKSQSKRKYDSDLLRLYKVRQDRDHYQSTPQEKFAELFRPTTLDGYGGIVEARIQKCMETYKPPGTSKPISLDEHFNPMIDTETFLLQKVMQNNNCTPRWIELQKEIKLDQSTIRSILKDKVVLWKNKGAIGNFRDTHYWKSVHECVEGMVTSLNKTILHFNLIVPSMYLQVPSFNLNNEITNTLLRNE